MRSRRDRVERRLSSSAQGSERCAGRVVFLIRLALSIQFVAFAGREKEIAFQTVLAVVQIAVATGLCIESLVRAFFRDAPFLDDKDLIGRPNGG